MSSEVESFAHATGLSVPAAREWIRLREKGRARHGDDDQSVQTYMAREVDEAAKRGMEWANEIRTFFLRNQ